VLTGFWYRDLRERGQLEDVHLVWKIILKRILKKWNGGGDWFDLAQDMDRRRVVVNEVKKLVFIKWTELLGWLRTYYLLKKDFVPLGF
jgi:hypothetical protein